MEHNGTFDDSFYDSVEAVTEEYNPSDETEGIDELEQARLEERWRIELARLEEEIVTLKSVLNAKVIEASELKNKLGITPIVELKEDLKLGLQAIKESETVQKTNEKLHQFGETISATGAYQKTNSAFKLFGAYASRKMGDLKNSNAFKSVEGKVEGAYCSIKKQVSGSKSEDNFEDVLRSSEDRQNDEPMLEENEEVY